MVNDADKFKAEDEKQKERISAKNGLESYCFNMKTTMEDGERCGQVQSGGREAEGEDLRQEWTGELLLQHEDNNGGREGEGQDIWRRQEGDQRQVRRHDQVAGREPARGGGRVPGEAEGGGGRLQPDHHQALWSCWRSTWRP